MSFKYLIVCKKNTSHKFIASWCAKWKNFARLSLRLVQFTIHRVWFSLTQTVLIIWLAVDVMISVLGFANFIFLILGVKFISLTCDTHLNYGRYAFVPVKESVIQLKFWSQYWYDRYSLNSIKKSSKGKILIFWRWFFLLSIWIAV